MTPQAAVSKRAKHIEVMVQAAVGMGHGKAKAQRVRIEKRKERKELLADRGDVGTPELRQHHQLVDHYAAVDGEEAVVKRVATQWPFDRYKARGIIGILEWRAGEKLRKTFERAGMQPRIIGSYQPDKIQSSAKAWDMMSDGQSDARADLDHTMRLLGALGGVALHVACLGGTAADWAASRFGLRGKPAEQAGMAALRLSLEQLIILYDMRSSRRSGSRTT